jgi:hypothetical protein
MKSLCARFRVTSGRLLLVLVCSAAFSGCKKAEEKTLSLISPRSDQLHEVKGPANPTPIAAVALSTQPGAVPAGNTALDIGTGFDSLTAQPKAPCVILPAGDSPKPTPGPHG